MLGLKCFLFMSLATNLKQLLKSNSGHQTTGSISGQNPWGNGDRLKECFGKADRIRKHPLPHLVPASYRSWSHLESCVRSEEAFSGESVLSPGHILPVDRFVHSLPLTQICLNIPDIQLIRFMQMQDVPSYSKPTFPPDLTDKIHICI